MLAGGGLQGRGEVDSVLPPHARKFGLVLVIAWIQFLSLCVGSEECASAGSWIETGLVELWLSLKVSSKELSMKPSEELACSEGGQRGWSSFVFAKEKFGIEIIEKRSASVSWPSSLKPEL